MSRERVLELEAGDARLTVHPDRGGRVGSLRVGGVELLQSQPAPNALLWGSYPMAPWAGRVRGATFEFDGVRHRLPIDAPPHALHGTVHDAEWEVVDAGRDHCELRCRLDRTGGWTLGGVAHQHVVLDVTGVTFVLSVAATTDRMPAVMGWHPCFTPPLGVDLHFSRMYERDDEGIATARCSTPLPLPWEGAVCDDCFTEPLPPLTLHYPGLDLRITSDCDHWVVFDGAATALCVEPQSGPPDAFNLGTAAILEPGDLLQRTMRWHWTTPGAPPTGR
jgi:aldose 1-epimerase